MQTEKRNQKIKALLNRINKMEDEITNSIHEICELSEYKESSLFSYNVDRFKKFVEELNYSDNILIDNEI